MPLAGAHRSVAAMTAGVVSRESLTSLSSFRYGPVRREAPRPGRSGQARHERDRALSEPRWVLGPPTRLEAASRPLEKAFYVNPVAKPVFPSTVGSCVRAVAFTKPCATANASQADTPRPREGARRPRYGIVGRAGARRQSP